MTDRRIPKIAPGNQQVRVSTRNFLGSGARYFDMSPDDPIYGTPTPPATWNQGVNFEDPPDFPGGAGTGRVFFQGLSPKPPQCTVIGMGRSTQNVKNFFYGWFTLIGAYPLFALSAVVGDDCTNHYYASNSTCTPPIDGTTGIVAAVINFATATMLVNSQYSLTGVYATVFFGTGFTDPGPGAAEVVIPNFFTDFTTDKSVIFKDGTATVQISG